MKYITPGVYIEPRKVKSDSIRLLDGGTAGFIGITEKGPLNKGVRVRSFSEFRKIFGTFTDFSYLAYSVFGFFAHGGKECVVIRVAHLDEDDELNSVSPAIMKLPSVNGGVSVSLKANSSGTWGNDIQVRLQHLNGGSENVSELGVDDDGKQWVLLESAEIFNVGDTVALRFGDNIEHGVIKEIHDQTLILTKSLKKIIGKQNNLICEKVRINVSLILKDKVEDYLNMSCNSLDEDYYIDAINSRSLWVHAEKGDSNSAPVQLNYINMGSGRNGILNLTPGDFIGFFKGFDNNTGMGIFEGYNDLSIIAAPDVLLFEEIVHNDKQRALDDIFAVQRALIDQSERLEDRFAILDTPSFNNSLDLIDWRNRFDSAFAAMYYPRAEIINPEDISGMTSILVPPSGHVAGVYIDCDKNEGVHRAPANKVLEGAVGLDNYIDADEYEILYSRGINCLKHIPGRGIKVWGAKTLSSEPEWKYINVRRTFSRIKEAIRTGTSWAVFEVNDNKLRKRLIRHISAFLLNLWRKGFLVGKTVNEAFFVRCDDELNPPEEVDAGRVNVDVGLSISKPAEFLVINLTAHSENSNISADE